MPSKRARSGVWIMEEEPSLLGDAPQFKTPSKRKRSGAWTIEEESNNKAQAWTIYHEGADTSYAPLDTQGTGSVSSHFLIDFLRKCGLEVKDDPRLADLLAALSARDALEKDVQFTYAELEQCTVSCRNVIRKAMAGQLRVPDFQGLSGIFRRIYDEVLPEKGGAVADYIPELARVDPEQFGMAVCTVDGQRFSVGDSKTQFCIQSCSKPISYLLALRRFGDAYVHDYVGHEPSGQRFNQMVLKDAPKPGMKNRQIPHNPCINAGAILCSSMVESDEKDQDERLQNILATWRELSGYSADPTCPVGYDEATYRSESATADRNWCLGYMMKERQSFPPCFTNLKDTLELYFKTCSITSTAEAMASAAATLANGGLCPLTGKRIFEPDCVQHALPIMLTCGMYDYSGTWAYQIGVPSKSGVGGCIFMVVPNVCGIAIWSPRLDEIGNSVRGVLAAKQLVNYITINSFEIFTHMASSKMNPVTPKDSEQQKALGEMVFAASVGDVNALQNLRNAGVNLYNGDFDHRTALHLAAAEGQKEVVSFLIENAPGELRESIVKSQDRWGGTPLDDALAGGHKECAELLRRAGSMRGAIADKQTFQMPGLSAPQETDVEVAIFAASRGDLIELIQINASGQSRNIFAGNYDMRTALHLAACEGHSHIVRYLLAQVPPSLKMQVLGYVGRYGGIAHDEAVKNGHRDCANLLRDAELSF